MGKHTEGPWRFNRALGKVERSDGGTICRLPRLTYQDGNLIAAAPDLLRELEWMLEQYAILTDHAEEYRPDSTIAAIAKARGGDNG